MNDDDEDGCKPDPLGRAEIEAALDEVVADWLAWTNGKDAAPGWHFFSEYRIAQESAFEDAGVSVPSISSEKAARLVEIAKRDALAFDFAGYIAGMRLAAHCDLTPALHLFAARVLTGEVKRPPKTGRPRSGDTLVRVFQYALCRFVERNTHLRLTRSREGSASWSACDAVAEAFQRAGQRGTAGTTYDHLQSLAYDRAHSDIRELANYLDILNN